MEYEHLIAMQESLFDPDADDNDCPGLAAVLQQSLNDVLPLDEQAACVWSLRNHAEITGASFLDLTADDRETGAKGVVKDEEEEDDGAAVNGDPLDFTGFDRYRRYR